MAYESITSYIEQIETLLAAGRSPQAVAKELGIPKQWRTIHRYKKEVFDFKKAASTEWEVEKQKGHEERFEAGKERIIDNFEFLNKMKIKADELLDVEAGDTYTVGNETRTVTPGSLAKIHGEAVRMGTAAIKAELELAGEDPASRAADSFLELIELAERGAGNKDS